MIGGFTGRPVANETGPGHADPDAAHVRGVPAGLGQEVAEAVVDPAEHSLRALRDVEPVLELRERRAGEVGHPDARVGGAEVGDEHDAGLVVEDQRGRRAAAGRDGPAHLGDEARATAARRRAGRRSSARGPCGGRGPRA